MITETTVKLSTPVKVAVDGAPVDCYEIHLVGPSWKNASAASALKSMWMEPFNKIMEEFTKMREGQKDPADKKEADKTQQEPHEIFTYSEVVSTISKYRDENTGPLNVMEKAFGYLETLLSGGCADFEGVAARKNLLERISYSDQEKILGEFVKSFLLDSLFS
jgi:hypothetical protein